MAALNIAKDKYTSFQEAAQYNFVWRMTLTYTLVSFLMLVFTIFTFITENRFSIFYFIAFVVMLSALILLKVLKAYKPIAIGLYAIVCVLIGFVIFTLSNRWGAFYLLINSIYFFIYYNYIFKDNAYSLINISESDLFVLSIEFAIAMLLIGFVMIQYSLVMKQAVKFTSVAYEELKEEKQMVELQNKEKTVLLQEIHHRVKNNLQVIISLLRIQSREIKSEEAKNSFEEAISRVLTMSLIHQKLYENKSFVDIDIKDYLDSLLKNLIHTGSVRKKIDFQVKSQLKSVDMKSIVPLGLIINELVSNSIKHAFNETGRIELTLVPFEEHGFKMTYFDNGQWKENDNNETFGVKLIEIFTEQLEGSYACELKTSGTYYYFTFKG